MTRTHLTLENVARLGRKMMRAYGIDRKTAEQIAEMNLKTANSYAEAAARVRG